MRVFLAILSAGLALAVQPAGAEPAISGKPWVIDGDTIVIQGTHVRLFGIDAPEIRQSCTRGGRAWRCGESAKWALIDFIAHRPVSCAERDVDRYGRIVAVCSLAGRDIDRWMVAQGWAVAYRHYSMDYAGDEDRAHTHRHGIWAGDFQMPWTWRWARENRL